jgi:hypothetical protein
MDSAGTILSFECHLARLSEHISQGSKARVRTRYLDWCCVLGTVFLLLQAEDWNRSRRCLRSFRGVCPEA